MTRELHKAGTAEASPIAAKSTAAEASPIAATPEVTGIVIPPSPVVMSHPANGIANDEPAQHSSPKATAPQAPASIVMVVILRAAGIRGTLVVQGDAGVRPVLVTRLKATVHANK